MTTPTTRLALSKPDDTDNAEVAVHTLIGAAFDTIDASVMAKIAEVGPLGSPAATMVFSNIPQTYRHLKLIVQGRMTGAVSRDWMYATFNGDSGNNYDNDTVVFVGTTPNTDSPIEYLAGTSAKVGGLTGANATANFAGQSEIFISNYRGTSFHKIIQATSAVKWANISGNIENELHSSHWRSTAAITSISLNVSTGNFDVGSVATLYGLP